MSRKLPNTEHSARPWRIHELTPDFHVEDVWAFRTPGARPDDFPAMLGALRAAGGLNENPPVVRFLFAVRWKLGAALGWDPLEQGPGRGDSICDRLPPDLRQDAAGEPLSGTPFTIVYELSDERAAELVNKTVHAILHLGWVPTGVGEYELRMAALVKANGRLGRLYMAAIKPFRYLIVYPAMTRKWERAWLDRARYPESDPPEPASSTGAAIHASADSDTRRPSRLVRWAGRLLVLYGAAHTVGALTVEGAGRHAGAWFGGDLWGADLADMSPAMSAYWLSVMSFGPPLVLLGVIVLWLDRHGISPPAFLAWCLGGWTVVDALIAGPQAGQGVVPLVAVGLLLAAARRSTAVTHPAPAAHGRTPAIR